MSSPKKPAVLLGVNKNYYFVNDVAYDMHFPIEWAMNHSINDATAKCGPEKCEHCYVYGHINNAFVGYCAYCLRAYDGMRGALYYAHPEPDDIIHLDTLSQPALEDRCPYMSGVPFSEIGNPDAMVMEREMIVEKLKCYGPTQQEIDMFYGLDLTNYGYDDDKSVDPLDTPPPVENEKRRLHQYIQDDMYDMRAYRAAPIQYSPCQERPRQVSPIQIPSQQASPIQLSPIQASPIQIAPYQFSPVHFSPIHFYPYQLSSVHFSPVHFSPVHFSPAQFSPGQVSRYQVSPSQVSPRQVSPHQVSPINSLSRGKVPTR